METKSGPVIFIPKNMIDDKYLSIVDAMIKMKAIKPSFKLLIEALRTATVSPDYSTDEGFFVRFFDSYALLKGKINPDYVKPKAMQVASKVTMYRKLTALEEIGFIVKFTEQKKYENFFTLGKGKPPIIYTLAFPSIGSEQESESNTTLQFSSDYRIARKQEKIDALSMDFGYFAQPLEQLASMDILAAYFNDCIRPSKALVTKNILHEKSIKNPESGKFGKISIETTTSTSELAEIMIGDDMVLLNYFYSSINERLTSTIENISIPFQNLFRFDKRSILIDLGVSDSGGNREVLDAQVSRIVNTQFTLESDSESLWLMKKLGLVDGNDIPYSKAPVRLLEEVGQYDDGNSASIDQIFKERGSRRYFDLKLPTFLERQINATIKQYNKKLEQGSSNQPILKMFNRDKHLLNGDEKGIIWLINDYLSSKLARPGFMTTTMPLAQFFSAFNAAINTKEHYMAMSRVLFNALGKQSHLLYRDEWIVNKRLQPRFLRLISLVDNKFLIDIENSTIGYSTKTRLSNIQYTFKAIRLTESEINDCKDRLNLVKEYIDYSEDNVFLKLAEDIFARSGITASQYKAQRK